MYLFVYPNNRWLSTTEVGPAVQALIRAPLGDFLPRAAQIEASGRPVQIVVDPVTRSSEIPSMGGQAGEGRRESRGAARLY